MPYKDPEDAAANKKLWWNYGLKLPLYRSMGLEPVDINDVRSALACSSCGKVTPRNCAHMFRHETDCEHALPRRYWNRRPKAVTA